MQVILQKDVKDLGKVGDLVKVAPGYARNFLFPRKLAVTATEKKVKEWTHLKKVADRRKKKALAEKAQVIEKLKSVSIVFKRTAGETDKLFGSITTYDISKELNQLGYQIDRRDVVMNEHIKMLGQHKATVKLGEGLECELTITVDRA